MLLMKKRFFGDIRSGGKTTTLRFWRRRHVRPGGLHTVPGLGKVRIETVEAIDGNDLTEADAHADGFDSLDALMRTLDEIYPPDERAGRNLYRIRFSYVPGEEPHRPADQPVRAP